MCSLRRSSCRTRWRATVTSAPPECCIAGAGGRPWPCWRAWLLAFQSGGRELPVPSRRGFRYCGKGGHAAVRADRLRRSPGSIGVLQLAAGAGGTSSSVDTAASICETSGVATFDGALRTCTGASECLALGAERDDPVLVGGSGLVHRARVRTGAALSPLEGGLAARGILGTFE